MGGEWIRVVTVPYSLGAGTFPFVPACAEGVHAA